MLAFEWTTLVSGSLLVISKLSAITLLGKCRICNSMCLSWDIKPWKHHILEKLRNFAQTSSQHYSSQMFSPKLNNKNILSTSTFHILCLWSISIFIGYNINEEVRKCATFLRLRQRSFCEWKSSCVRDCAIFGEANFYKNLFSFLKFIILWRPFIHGNRLFFKVLSHQYYLNLNNCTLYIVVLPTY